MIAKLRLLGPAGLTKKCGQHSHSQQFCSRIAVKYLVPVPDELYGPVRQKEPDGPHDGEGWEGEVVLLLLLLVAHCCKHSTICHVTIWSGDFNASTFCGGLEIGNNCTVMKHSKPRLAVWWWWEQQVDCLCLCRLPRLLARTLPGD